jgi:hypothetical protein
MSPSGTARWPGGEDSEPLIRVGARWRDCGTGEVVLVSRSVLTETVAPGATTCILVLAGTPPDPGDYDLEVDLVHEYVRWFGCGVHSRVRVEAEPVRRFDGIVADLAAELPRLRRELADARERAEKALQEAEALKRTRRYRVATGLARPLEAARRRLGRKPAPR